MPVVPAPVVVPLRIERRGQTLGLRGRLPRRDGAGFQVQRLSLGFKADGTGPEAAVQQLHQTCGDLASGRFRGSVELLHQALGRFKDAFDADPVRSRNPAGQRSTWATAYWPYLRRLVLMQEQQQRPLGQELLLQTPEDYQLASRSRQQCGTVLGALARQEGIPLPEDWSKRSGGYGLRNHEVFFCDCSALRGDGAPVVRGWSGLPWPTCGEHRSPRTWSRSPSNRWGGG